MNTNASINTTGVTVIVDGRGNTYTNIGKGIFITTVNGEMMQVDTNKYPATLEKVKKPYG